MFALAESIPGPSTDALGELARELGIVIIASLFERRAAGVYHNTAVVINVDGRNRSACIARCTSPTIRRTTRNSISHPAIWASGISILRSAASACWCAGTSGIRKARAFRRWRARTFCSIPLPSAGTRVKKAAHGASQQDAWKTIQRSHAIANGIYVAAVNRVGHEGSPDSGIEFWGSSFVAAPFGQVIAQASQSEEETLVVECDTHRMEEVRQHWPFLRDRRIDAYGPIVNRWIDQK